MSIAWGAFDVHAMFETNGTPFTMVGMEFELYDPPRHQHGVVGHRLDDKFTPGEYAEIIKRLGLPVVLLKCAKCICVAAIGDTETAQLDPHVEYILDSYRSFLIRARANSSAADQA